MAVVRMHFKKGTEGWDYGYLTVQLWLKTFMTWAFREDKVSAMAFWRKHDMDTLIKQFQDGEALFNIHQTIFFLQVTNRLSAYLVSGVDGLSEELFGIVKVKTDRFKTVKEFEEFYLHWSSQTLKEIEAEFEKEPLLKGKFNKIITS